MWKRMEDWFGRTLRDYSRLVHKLDFPASCSVAQLLASFKLCTSVILVT
jgi:hypothetical protein